MRTARPGEVWFHITGWWPYGRGNKPERELVRLVRVAEEGHIAVERAWWYPDKGNSPSSIPLTLSEADELLREEAYHHEGGSYWRRPRPKESR